MIFFRSKLHNCPVPAAPHFNFTHSDNQPSHVTFMVFYTVAATMLHSYCIPDRKKCHLYIPSLINRYTKLLSSSHTTSILPFLLIHTFDYIYCVHHNENPRFTNSPLNIPRLKSLRVPPPPCHHMYHQSLPSNIPI